MGQERRVHHKAGYAHLTIDDRAVISVMKEAGRSQKEIAERLKISPSTISRELKRNAPPLRTGYYLPHKAHERYKERFSTSHQRPSLKNDMIRSYVEENLKGKWSPEQISGRLRIDHPGQRISHEAIYQYIYSEQPQYVKLLARAHRKRKYRGQGKSHKTSHIPNRTPITERPEGINNRTWRGHWEADTMVSRRSSCTLVTLNERKTKTVIMDKVKENTAEAVSNAIIARMKRLPKRLRRSITYDNGHENVMHEKVNKALGMKSYFCAPYHSWEKGTVENTNGLIRRYLPKGTDFGTIKKSEIHQIENALNKRPRKCLRYKTPLEVLERQVALAL